METSCKYARAFSDPSPYSLSLYMQREKGSSREGILSGGFSEDGAHRRSKIIRATLLIAI